MPQVLPLITDSSRMMHRVLSSLNTWKVGPRKWRSRWLRKRSGSARIRLGAFAGGPDGITPMPQWSDNSRTLCALPGCLDKHCGGLTNQLFSPLLPAINDACGGPDYSGQPVERLQRTSQQRDRSASQKRANVCLRSKPKQIPIHTLPRRFSCALD